MAKATFGRHKAPRGAAEPGEVDGLKPTSRGDPIVGPTNWTWVWLIGLS